MSEEENVIQDNEQQPENVYDKESKQGSTTSQSDNESDNLEEHQDYEYILPAYFGILDLFGEDVEVKNLFTDEEWNEMNQDFKSNANLNGLEDEQERPLYELMDKIAEVLRKKPSDLIISIENCVIEGNMKVNVIRRLIQT
ncbi:10991_t:CDS:2 [Acaulospora colombiana]|uniref:10991_t:CDS:1 n=1 Tax=Acaulospora colombiana TaxID=27376 RepID=A0ACA9L9V7_9GLOM|nr:10991_t:CDS:2 [Acaulospora colombiana]